MDFYASMWPHKNKTCYRGPNFSFRDTPSKTILPFITYICVCIYGHMCTHTTLHISLLCGDERRGCRALLYWQRAAEMLLYDPCVVDARCNRGTSYRQITDHACHCMAKIAGKLLYLRFSTPVCRSVTKRLQ